MTHKSKTLLTITAVIAAFAFPGAGRARAAELSPLDLTTAGKSGTITGSGSTGAVTAVFAENEQRPTGTGFIDSFSRLQANKTEEGFNTNGTPPYDEKAGLWTHAITLNSLAPVTLTPGGTPYYQFLLDINQNKSPGDPSLLNLNRLQIWGAQSATLNASNYDFGANGSFDDTGNTDGSTGKFIGSNATLVYDIDGQGDNGVLLNYALNSGSGSGDMFLYIPVAAFANLSGDPSTWYLYLYSAFGNPNASNDGFEEWAAHTGEVGTPFGVPEPSTLALALSGFVGLGLTGVRRFRRQKAVA